MRATFLTNTKIKEEWLDELKQYVDWDISIVETTENIPPKYNPYFKQMWADFDWIRGKLSTGDIKCFVTTKAALKAIGVTSHIGMYDKADGDTKHDYYIGLPDRLDKRAKANGFLYNFAWLVIHEYLHGEEKQSGTPDRVHDMEEQGRLKELLKEHQERRKKLFTIKRLLELVVSLIRPQRGDLLPLVKRQASLLEEEMAILGLPVNLVEGYRSPERQAELYAQGRTKPGAIVTQAKSGESLHQYGVAIDYCFKKQGYNATDAQWETFGTMAERFGFRWGGRWSGFQDKPHVEMTKQYTLADFQQGKVDYKDYA